MLPQALTPAETARNEEGDLRRPTIEEGQAHSLLDSLYDSMLTSTSQDQALQGILEEVEQYMSDRKKGDPLEW